MYNSDEAGETRSLALENFLGRLSLSMVYMPACTWYMATKGHSPCEQYGRRNHCIVAFMDFPTDEDRQKPTETKEQTDDSGRAPWVGGAAPLESEEDQYDGRNEKESTDEIEIFDTISDGFFLSFSRRLVEEEDEGQARGTANGEIDVEAPPPRDILCEYTAEDWSYHRCHSKH